MNLNVRDISCSARFYTEALGFVLISDYEETIDFGAGPERLHQVILTVPQSRTILALTQAPSLQIGAVRSNHLGLILESDEDVTTMVERVPRYGGFYRRRANVK